MQQKPSDEPQRRQWAQIVAILTDDRFQRPQPQERDTPKAAQQSQDDEQ